MPRPRLAALNALLIMTSCGWSDPFSPDEARRLDRAERQWRTAAITNYDFEYRAACFCPPEINHWTRLEVRNGRVARATPLTSFVTQEDADRYLWWPTIDSLFVQIRGSATSDWVKDASLQFDSRYGFPIEASFSSKPNIADAGSEFYVRNFVAR